MDIRRDRWAGNSCVVNGGGEAIQKPRASVPRSDSATKLKWRSSDGELITTATPRSVFTRGVEYFAIASGAGRDGRFSSSADSKTKPEIGHPESSTQLCLRDCTEDKRQALAHFIQGSPV